MRMLREQAPPYPDTVLEARETLFGASVAAKLARVPNRELLAASEHELRRLGLKPAQASKVRAWALLAGLACAEARPRGGAINSAAQAYEHVKHLRLEDRETFVALALDAKHNLIEVVGVSRGAGNATVIQPRDLFHDLIRRGAHSCILAHNHPSGDATPSQDDVELTRRLKRAGEILGIGVLDHLVIGDGQFVSLQERGV